MAAMGFTLNQITMLALTLMVGIVIDDAIIVLENIYRFIEEKNMPPFQAAIQGTKEIGLAVMATTLSLLAVFLPVGFMGGIVGRFMSSFGFTVGVRHCGFAAGLLHAHARCSARASSSGPKPAEPGPALLQGLLHLQVPRYATTPACWRGAWRIARRWSRSACCVILSIVPLFMFVGKNFLPQDDQSQYNVLIRTPEGTSLAATTNLAERIAQDIRSLPGVAHTLMTAGGSADKSVNNASIYVKLTDIDQRSVTQQQLMQRTRDLMKKYPPEIHTGVELVSSRRRQSEQRRNSILHPGPRPAEARRLFRRRCSPKCGPCPALVDADTTLRTGKPEVRLEIDRPRAADLGVSVMDIEQALNTLVAGQTASTFNAGDDQYDVVVRAQEQFRGGVEGLAKMTVPSAKLRLRRSGRGGAHHARHRPLVHQPHRPPAPGDAHRQRAARRIAGRRHSAS